METRNTTELVEFHFPFLLMSCSGVMPSGCYVVELQEEKMEGLSFPAWRRINMTISRDGPRPGRLREALPLTPAELAAVLAADEEAR